MVYAELLPTGRGKASALCKAHMKFCSGYLATSHQIIHDKSGWFWNFAKDMTFIHEETSMQAKVRNCTVSHRIK
jgi:hypothetical protein